MDCPPSQHVISVQHSLPFILHFLVRFRDVFFRQLGRLVVIRLHGGSYTCVTGAAASGSMQKREWKPGNREISTAAHPDKLLDRGSQRHEDDAVLARPPVVPTARGIFAVITTVLKRGHRQIFDESGCFEVHVAAFAAVATRSLSLHLRRRCGSAHTHQTPSNPATDTFA